MIQMCIKIDWILLASFAAIVTLILAVVTYWIDFINKFRFKKQLKGQITTELRPIYSACRDLIVDYMVLLRPQIN